jgi:pyridoxamine 5'-phosphate oxidase
MNLADIRKEYKSHTLDERHTHPDPFRQFGQWMQEAIEAQANEPTAMHLATVGPDGRPSGRIVLLKGIELGGFVFYTNYNSRKGGELAAHPQACLTFYWAEMERQVRIEGRVEPVPADVSDAYFQSRPRGSQIGAHVSHQSQPVDRQALEDRYAALEAEYADGRPVARPPHWGGYVLRPETVEFWQGRPSRLHDRVLYALDAGQWIRTRLSP